MRSSRSVALVEGLIVAALWASSAVLIKMGLREAIGPLTLAGLRYFLAALALFPLALRNRAFQGSLSTSLWLRLILMGISAYTIGNGTFFWGVTISSGDDRLVCTQSYAVAGFGGESPLAA